MKVRGDCPLLKLINENDSYSLYEIQKFLMDKISDKKLSLKIFLAQALIISEKLIFGQLLTSLFNNETKTTTS